MSDIDIITVGDELDRALNAVARHHLEGIKIMVSLSSLLVGNQADIEEVQRTIRMASRWVTQADDQEAADLLEELAESVAHRPLDFNG